MSPATHNRTTAPHPRYAPLFAALGDETRLALVGELGRGRACSIAQLTAGSKLTRQAITKHLRVLEGAGLVSCVRSGRQSLFALDPAIATAHVVATSEELVRTPDEFSSG